MAAFDDGTRVLSLGSVSSRSGVGCGSAGSAPRPALVQRLAAARALGDMAGPVLDQLVVAALLADPGGRRWPSSGPGWPPARPRCGRRWPATCRTGCRSTPRGGDVAVGAAARPVRHRTGPARAVGRRADRPGPRFGPDGTMESYLRLPFTARAGPAGRRGPPAGLGRPAVLGGLPQRPARLGGLARTVADHCATRDRRTPGARSCRRTIGAQRPEPKRVRTATRRSTGRPVRRRSGPAPGRTPARPGRPGRTASCSTAA